MAYSPWDHKELDMTECNHTHILDFPLFIEGSKNLRIQKYAFPVLKLLSSPIFRLKIIINFYLKVCLMSANYVKLWISYALFPLNSRGSHISSTMSFSQWFVLLFSCQVSPTLCNPMGCSTPCLPVPLHLPEFAQVHVHWIGDFIQPSVSSFVTLFSFNLQSIWGGCSYQVASVSEFQLQHPSFQFHSNGLIQKTSLQCHSKKKDLI